MQTKQKMSKIHDTLNKKTKKQKNHSTILLSVCTMTTQINSPFF